MSTPMDNRAVDNAVPEAGSRSSRSSRSAVARARAKAEAARTHASFAEKETKLKIENARRGMDKRLN